MAFESEDRKSDFESWAESMTYEEERELKRQEKIQLKEKKKAERAAKKRQNKASEDIKEEATSEDNAAEEQTADVKISEEESSTKITSEENSAEEKAADDAESEENSSEDTEDQDEGSKKKKKKKAKEEYNPDYIKEKKKEPEDINIVKELLSLIIYIGVVIILCYCIITFVGQRTTVNGRSMESTLHDGDNLWIDKLSYRFSDPKRFDIIVFPYEEDTYYIKRIIGLPGETVQIMPDGTILIDGKKLVESYGKEIILESGTAADPRTLGEDEYFVLGDNRNDSRDSRWADVGDINREDIIGKAAFRLSPFSKFGKIDK